MLPCPSNKAECSKIGRTKKQLIVKITYLVRKINKSANQIEAIPRIRLRNACLKCGGESLLARLAGKNELRSAEVRKIVGRLVILVDHGTFLIDSDSDLEPGIPEVGCEYPQFLFPCVCADIPSVVCMTDSLV